GVETYPTDFHTIRKWFYLAGIQVTTLDAVPLALVGKILPANRYAVFSHEGTLPGRLCETFQSIYQQWLPQSGLKLAGAYDFERYDARFLGPLNAESVMEIYVPVLPQA